MQAAADQPSVSIRHRERPRPMASQAAPEPAGEDAPLLPPITPEIPPAERAKRRVARYLRTRLGCTDVGDAAALVDIVIEALKGDA